MKVLSLSFCVPLIHSGVTEVIKISYSCLITRMFFLLFRKPISSIGFCVDNEVIASSNPISQIDTETYYLLEKVVCEEASTQEKYLKIDCATELKEQWQGKMLTLF